MAFINIKLTKHFALKITRQVNNIATRLAQAFSGSPPAKSVKSYRAVLNDGR
jgi:hypothetical protein